MDVEESAAYFVGIPCYHSGDDTLQFGLAMWAREGARSEIGFPLRCHPIAPKPARNFS